MSATIAAIPGGNEIRPTTSPLAVAIHHSGTSPFKTTNQAMGLFIMGLRRYRSARTYNRTNANLERQARPAETGRVDAAGNDEAGTCMQSITCERRRK